MSASPQVGRGFTANIGLPEDFHERLAAFGELVRVWAPKLDLVAAGDLERLEERHFADSLRAVAFLDQAPAGPAIDVGSGAGFPGVPLALARPERAFRLLEPRRRRAAFLEEVVRALELEAEVVPLTAAQAAGEARLARAHSFAVARALAAAEASFQLMGPLVSPEGIRLLFVGERGEIPPYAEDLGGGLAKIGP